MSKEIKKEEQKAPQKKRICIKYTTKYYQKQALSGM